MGKNSKNIVRDTVQDWVDKFNEIPNNVINKLIEFSGYNDFQEITPPALGDTVIICDGEHDGEYGEISKTHYRYDGEPDLYAVRVMDGNDLKYELILSQDEFEVQDQPVDLPTLGMWSFDAPQDKEWLDDPKKLQTMANCGFRIYESEDFGYIFGIDGGGYDFIGENFIPLFEAIRGHRMREWAEDWPSQADFLEALHAPTDPPKEKGGQVKSEQSL